MRLRLRPQHPPEVLAQLYPAPHQHTRWPDHLLRAQATIAVAKWMSSGEAESVGLAKCKSGADLSCGDGAILKALDLETKYFGDFAAGYPIQGDIAKTLVDLPPVDIFINCETLEHVDQPDDLLRTIRLKSHRLVLSTPDGDCDRGNVEHLWIWSREAVEEMLKVAGWKWVTHVRVGYPEWVNNWNIWGCV